MKIWITLTDEQEEKRITAGELLEEDGVRHSHGDVYYTVVYDDRFINETHEHLRNLLAGFNFKTEEDEYNN